MADQKIVSTTAHPEVVWVTVHTQKLDENSTELFRSETISAAARTPALPIVLDLQAVEFVPSMALGALVALNRDFKQQGRRFVLVGVNAVVRPVFALTRLDKLFEMQPSLDDALGRLREQRN
jgi:anti-sigma B factor antagonist